MSKVPTSTYVPSPEVAAAYAKRDAQAEVSIRQWAVEQAVKIMRTPDDVERVAARFLHYAVHGTFPIDEGVAS